MTYELTKIDSKRYSLGLKSQYVPGHIEHLIYRGLILGLTK